MITDIIVVASIAFSLAFSLAWLLSPRLRAWIEQPKYEFQEHLSRHDRLLTRNSDTKGGRPA